jgi:SAM-dependent methyltransferase
MKNNAYREERDFYDAWTDKFLYDFLRGNPRQESAVHYVVGALGHFGRPVRVLDFGCGMGSNSFLISQHPQASVVAIDLSERLVALGRSLFESQGNCEFFNGSIEDLVLTRSEDKFDAISVLDVLEHVRWEDWPELFRHFNALIAEDGVVVITTPTPTHQAWLSKHNPAGLQPVDLSIEKSDVARFAKEQGFQVVDYRTVSPFGQHDRGDDYQYFVLSKLVVQELNVDISDRGAKPAFLSHSIRRSIVRRQRPDLYYRRFFGIRSYFAQLKSVASRLKRWLLAKGG